MSVQQRKAELLETHTAASIGPARGVTDQMRRKCRAMAAEQVAYAKQQGLSPTVVLDAIGVPAVNADWRTAEAWLYAAAIEMELDPK